MFHFSSFVHLLLSLPLSLPISSHFFVLQFFIYLIRLSCTYNPKYFNEWYKCIIDCIIICLWLSLYWIVVQSPLAPFHITMVLSDLCSEKTMIRRLLASFLRLTIDFFATTIIKRLVLRVPRQMHCLYDKNPGKSMGKGVRREVQHTIGC